MVQWAKPDDPRSELRSHMKARCGRASVGSFRCALTEKWDTETEDLWELRGQLAWYTDP